MSNKERCSQFSVLNVSFWILRSFWKTEVVWENWWGYNMFCFLESWWILWKDHRGKNESVVSICWKQIWFLLEFKGKNIFDQHFAQELSVETKAIQSKTWIFCKYNTVHVLTLSRLTTIHTVCINGLSLLYSFHH